MTDTYILLGILALLSVLLLLLLSFSNLSDDPGYGTEHSGTYMVGGLLFLLIIVDLIFLAFFGLQEFSHKSGDPYSCRLRMQSDR